MRLYKINMCQEAVQCGLEMLCNKGAILCDWYKK